MYLFSYDCLNMRCNVSQGTFLSPVFVFVEVEPVQFVLKKCIQVQDWLRFRRNFVFIVFVALPLLGDCQAGAPDGGSWIRLVVVVLFLNQVTGPLGLWPFGWVFYALM
jgi:hypothetical protein